MTTNKPQSESLYVEPLGFKGTKGEWYINDLNKGYLSIDVDEKEPDCEDWHSYAIAEIKPTTNDAWEKDAQLISQSKELAKALQDIVDYLDKEGVRISKIDMLRNAHNVLKKAGL